MFVMTYDIEKAGLGDVMGRGCSWWNKCSSEVNCGNADVGLDPLCVKSREKNDVSFVCGVPAMNQGNISDGARVDIVDAN